MTTNPPIPEDFTDSEPTRDVVETLWHALTLTPTNLIDPPTPDDEGIAFVADFNNTPDDHDTLMARLYTSNRLPRFDYEAIQEPTGDYRYGYLIGAEASKNPTQNVMSKVTNSDLGRATVHDGPLGALELAVHVHGIYQHALTAADLI